MRVLICKMSAGRCQPRDWPCRTPYAHLFEFCASATSATVPECLICGSARNKICKHPGCAQHLEAACLTPPHYSYNFLECTRTGEREGVTKPSVTADVEIARAASFSSRASLPCRSHVPCAEASCSRSLSARSSCCMQVRALLRAPLMGRDASAM